MSWLVFSCPSSGVLVQPQWKHFAHIEMVKNDKIRLSNGIWRSWHLQCECGGCAKLLIDGYSHWTVYLADQLYC